MLRPGYIFDNHKELVEQLNVILDKAAVEYDEDFDVVDDFTQYVKDWPTVVQRIDPEGQRVYNLSSLCYQRRPT